MYTDCPLKLYLLFSSLIVADQGPEPKSPKVRLPGLMLSSTIPMFPFASVFQCELCLKNCLKTVHVSAQGMTPVGGDSKMLAISSISTLQLREENGQWLSSDSKSLLCSVIFQSPCFTTAASKARGRELSVVVVGFACVSLFIYLLLTNKYVG